MKTFLNRRTFIILLFSVSITVIGTKAYGQRLNLDSIRNVANTAKEDSTKLDAMLLFARQSRDSLGQVYLDSALKLSRERNYYAGIAQGLIQKASKYRDDAAWELAIESLREAIKVGETIPDDIRKKQVLRAAYNNLGGIYNINGDFTTALENRLKSVEYIESMPDPSPNDLAISTINAASDYRQLKEWKKAQEYMLKVTPFLPRLQDRLKLEYYYEYYQILIGGGEKDRAFRVLEQYDSILNVANFSERQRLDYTMLSKRIHGLYEMEHTYNYANALFHFQAGLPLAEELGTKTEMATAYYNIGWAHYELANNKEAIKALTESYNIASDGGMLNQAYKPAIMLASLYERINDIGNAYKFSRRAMVLKDSIVQGEAIEQLNFLEAKYQSEKKEKEIARLQTTNQEKEFLIRRKTWFMTGAIIAAVLLALLAAFVFRYYKNRQQLLQREKHLQEEKIISMEKQQQVASLQSMINGQETERTRIAKDLHDGLGGVFSTVKMHYSTLQQETPEIKVNPLYKKTLDLINNASDELRRVAHNMMPEVLMKVGLVEALQDFCNNISSGKLLKVSLQTYGMDKRLGSGTEIMLYRIIQELVNNIIKHAHATEAIIQINREGNRLSLTIEDNGRGFDTREAEERRSMGMATVKSRVDYLNGHLTIDSRKDIGTTVMIDLLLNEN